MNLHWYDYSIIALSFAIILLQYRPVRSRLVGALLIAAQYVKVQLMRYRTKKERKP